MKKLLIALILTLAFLPSCLVADNAKQPLGTYEDCVKAGHPTTRSFPPSCLAPGGLIFKKDRQPDQSPGRPAGICVNNCGNGQCEEMVCMGTGCPCAESSQNCPADCPGH